MPCIDHQRHGWQTLKLEDATAGKADSGCFIAVAPPRHRTRAPTGHGMAAGSHTRSHLQSGSSTAAGSMNQTAPDGETALQGQAAPHGEHRTADSAGPGPQGQNTIKGPHQGSSDSSSSSSDAARFLSEAHGRSNPP